MRTADRVPGASRPEPSNGRRGDTFRITTVLRKIRQQLTPLQ